MYKLPEEFDTFNTLSGGFQICLANWEDVNDMWELTETHDLLLELNINHSLN
jgi:hypothetical protein